MAKKPSDDDAYIPVALHFDDQLARLIRAAEVLYHALIQLPKSKGRISWNEVVCEAVRDLRKTSQS